jgi:carbamoyltransferase
MFSKKFDDWPICVKEKVREDFLLHIKSEIKEQPTTIIFGSLIDKDLELLRKIFPTCENYEQFDAHHLSHAYGSYFQSPFKDALVFTVDGGGSDLGAYTTTKVYAANGNNILEILKPNLDFGNTYSYIGIPISEISPGKDNNDLGVFLSYAGKIMGLCAYGNINDKWIPAFESFYLHRDIKRLGREINLDLSLNTISGQLGYDLAATSQHVFENLLMEFMLNIFYQNKKNIVMTGGCALNVLFNQKLKKILNAEGYDLYVPPNPNDCGQSLGQYLYKTKEHIEPLVYSGFDILDRDKFDLFLSNGKYFTEESSPEKIVSLISEGKIGGIIQGYSEVGPRALGNRSIICDPSFKDMKDILNAKVKFREWFRPFAPVCREEDMHKYFDDAFASHYMSYAPLVKKEYRDKLPSITHYDGTSRLQTVNSKQHKLFYDILSCMQNTKKIPVILNTSFNIKGRPILTKIEDAFYVLDNTELDFLVVENLLVFKK